MLKYYEQKQGKKALKNKGKSKFINGALFKNQFKLNFKALLIWSLVICGILGLVLAIYPVIKPMLEELMSQPSFQDTWAPIMEIFGSSTFENIAEYYVVEGLQMYVLTGAIFASILGVNLIKKEIAGGSVEFLYSRPISKGAIFRSKLLTFIINIVLFNIIVNAVSLSVMAIVDGGINFDVLNFLAYVALATLIHLQIGIIIFSITAIIKKKASVGLGLGIAVITYFFSLIYQIVSDVNFLKYFTPFSYVTNDIINLGFNAVNLTTLGIWSIGTLLLLTVSHAYFKRNDVVV